MAMNKTTDSTEEQMNEEIGDFLRLGTLLMLLAVPGIINAEDIKENLPKTAEVTAQTVMNAISKVDVAIQTYGGYTASQASNILARTLYMEARSQVTTGMDAVASVILNRAGGKAEKMPYVCLKPSQFSCWNDIGNKDSKNYAVKIPKGAAKKGKDQTAWTYCQTLAGKLLNGDFKSTIGNRNSYHTTAVAPKWDSKMKDKKTIGKHVFGYLPENDGYRAAKIAKKQVVQKKTEAPTQKTIPYVVKDGDILGRIAIKNGTTVNAILKANPQLNGNANKIRAGKTIQIPVKK